MDFNDYQTHALRTAIYHESPNISDSQGLDYVVLGLASEAGEVASILKKFLRDGGSPNHLRDKMIAELGDVLWYVAMIAVEIDVSLNTIALNNMTKLRDRQERGTLGGSGDTR